MSINYTTRAAIAVLPGKTVRPWKDGDPRCHCTHCDLCGVLYRTEDIAKHETECQAALLLALDRAAVIESPRDRFAMAALSGLLSDPGVSYEDALGVARDCYRIADAMLDARKS